MPRYNNTNTQDRATNPTTNSEAMYSYGNYYTWHSAIADTTYYYNNNNDPGTSLCPSHWKLPDGGQRTVKPNSILYTLSKSIMKDAEGNSIEPNKDTNNGFGYYDNTITNANGDTATKAYRRFPNNFLYSGYYSVSSAYNRGNNSGYWSSTVRDNNNSYRLSVRDVSVSSGLGSGTMNTGNSVRCVATQSD